MRRAEERGIAAAEFALSVPVMVLMVMLCVEGGNALRTYGILQEASREGARLVLNQAGGTQNVAELVRGITAQLPAPAPSTSIRFDAAKDNVTVEVSYAYRGFFGADSVFEAIDNNTPVVRARTIMPLP